MTAPQADGADRLPRLTGSTLRASTAASGLIIFLLVGLLLRLTIAYVLLPNSGFETDIAAYAGWARRLWEIGPGGFYAEGYFADYPPGYMYVLWLGSHLVSFLNGGTLDGVSSDVLKIGPIVADVLVALVIYGLTRRWTVRRSDSKRLALLAAGLYLFNPLTWYDSAVWGQTDAVGMLVILLAIGALIRGNSEGAAALTVIAALVKPQFGILLVPVVGIVLLRRHLLVAGSGPRNPPLVGGALGDWLSLEQGVWRLVSSAVVGLGLLVVLLIPFGLDIIGFVTLMVRTAGGYPWLSVNAYNPWALFGAGGTEPLFLSGFRWSPDTVPFLGPLPAVLIGTTLLVAGFLVGVLRLAWRDDRRSILVVTTFLALAFFMLPTRVHERYLFPVFGLLPLLAVTDRRWLWALIALSVSAFINFHAVLSFDLYATPNLESLPLGDLFRSPLGVLVSVALGIGGFAFVAWQLRPAAAGEPELDQGEDPGPADDDDVEWATAEAGDAELQPLPGGPGPAERARSWLARLVTVRQFRRDRSVLLVGEPGGRLDRRDAAVILLVFVAAFLLRAYRLEVPYAMHFDEVYHARTAVEFLQHWRYGEPHGIYEFTHPHMAKYLMALGIAGLGNNRVTAEGDLGVPVTGAAIEERWSPPGATGQRNGDRLLVTTGSELRAIDLVTAATDASIAGPYTSLAVYADTHTIYLGQDDGTIWWLDTRLLDEARAGISPGSLSPQLLTTVSGLQGELVDLELAGTVLAALDADGTVISLDPSSGLETGRTSLRGAHSPVGTPSRSQIVVDPAEVDDPEAVAQTLAGLIGDEPERIAALILEADRPVIVAGYFGNADDGVQTEIDEGNLPGVSISSGAGIAVATDTGITLLDAVTLTRLASFYVEQPVGGMDLVEQGVDQPTIYAAAGDELITLRMPTDQAASLSGSVWMPSGVSDVVWNPATTMVHALGLSQDGDASTVYVVEPRSNSVFADARLGFAPDELVLDAQPDRPAEDRVDLLAISSDGRVATIDVGGNGYAYRLPGVIAGALTAALIYLLARFLFRRRSVALIAAALVLVDGMFFANARIAMNDTYVALFIVAALTVFVPLWLGRWRGGWATAGGLLAVGLLLGLALSAKWVGAYAIGAVGLLILLRSALGRLIALGAMIVLTGFLGYVAITPNPSLAAPQLNYIFLALMIGLTVLLAVGITRRPIRFTLDELRLVIVAPVLGGAALAAYGAYRLIGGAVETEGVTAPDRLVVLGSLAVIFGIAVAVGAWFAGRRGFGPLAKTPRVEMSLEPAAPPPPRGWLRPGSGRLGLPWILALLAITVIPLAVYTASYLPWVELGNRWTETFPDGNTGQPFLDLQRSMYDYHNFLRAKHPASSPWWAWPLDLKPVWFEQNSYAGSTTAVIYDTGNLVVFWLAIPAVAWVTYQAWRRRSLSLAFLCVAIACLWLPWARIDRATFQYHIFTTLPFSFLALAYFLAELWHGPSRRTWMLARVAAALAIIGAPLLWLLRQPLCGIANSEQVNPGSEVCASLSRDLMLTDIQGFGLFLALGGLAAAGILVYASVRSARRGEPAADLPGRSLLLPISFSVALLGVVILIVGAGLPGNQLFTARVFAEQPALVALLLLAVPAYFVLRATDPRKYVVAALWAAVVWFVAFYTNIASLPVATPLSQIHLGLLPTWNWGFQFGVNLDEPNRAPIEWGSVAILTLAVIGLCVAAAYAARNWYSVRGEPESEVSEAAEPG